MTGPLENVRLCHCDFCRRGNGSAFSANCRIPVERFAVVHDDGTLRHFENTPGAKRFFCGTCGSPVFAKVDSDPDHIRVRLGTLDRDAAAEVVGHAWVDSMAAWDSIVDDLPQFGEAAPAK
ncbi:MAG TPA: GFA family protein [Croceibacterium sp.]|nr:GFA family protein [Croceibacterium sp.]